MANFFDELGKSLWGTVDFLSSVKEAKRIKEDPERQPTSFRFAVHTILCGASMLIASVFVGLLLLLKLFQVPALNLALGIFIGVGGLLLFAHMLKNWILQFSINRNTWTWVSLGFMIFAIVGSVAVMLIFAFAV